MTEEGNFIVVGTLLTSLESGQVMPIPSQAAIVSKDTVPPLDENGREDFSNPFGAPYSIVRHLDLSPDSLDLNMVVYANSFGPPVGNFGGGARIPGEGDSTYNLNGFGAVTGICPELFPSESQKYTYTRPRFPLHKVPIWGLLGDDVEYDVNTGEAIVPRVRNGAECFPDGCLGEDPVGLGILERTPITLGQWLEADVKVKIMLTDYNAEIDAYTAAMFQVTAKNLLPDAMYQVMMVRSSRVLGQPIVSIPHIGALPPRGLLTTNAKGAAKTSFKMSNPFPNPVTDDAGLRNIGMVIGYRSDFAVLGLCAHRFGPGVDIHTVVSTFANGTFDMTPFITEAAP